MQQQQRMLSQLFMTGEDNQSSSTRRELFITTAAVAAGVGSGFVPFLPSAEAVSGINKVNAKLRGYGLPTVGKVPDGLTPALEVYGKGANRFPILVQFNYPVTWVLTVPSNDVNGEDGTVQAGDYGKGDTATFYMYSDPGNVKNIVDQPKQLFEDAIIKSISQKGSNIYQDFKITKLVQSPDDPNYMIADFKYVLLTGAGFEVGRKGVASITSTGNGVQVLWCAVTTQRWKKMEDTLRDIAGSFRCYTEGINFESELYEFVKMF